MFLIMMMTKFCLQISGVHTNVCRQKFGQHFEQPCSFCRSSSNILSQGDSTAGFMTLQTAGDVFSNQILMCGNKVDSKVLEQELAATGRSRHCGHSKLMSTWQG